MRTVTDCAVGRSENELAAIKFVTRTISVLGSLVDNLIESRENVISELHLSDGSCAGGCEADSKTTDTLLGERSVENSVSAVFLVETHRAAEDTSKLDVLTEYHCVVIGLKSNVQGIANGRAQIHFLSVGWVLKLELLNIQLVCEIE